MRSICILRTHQFGAQERRQLGFLKSYFVDDLVVAADTTTGSFQTDDYPCVEMNIETVTEWGIRPPLNTWAWQCGDLAFYAVRRAFPDYDHYWIVEPDVWFHFDEARDFFTPIDRLPHDMLTIRFEEAQEEWKWRQVTLRYFPKAYRMLFPFVRLSGKLIDEAFEQRRRINGQQRRAIGTPNDEALVGAVCGIGDYSVATFDDLFGRKVFVEQYLRENILEAYPNNGRIYHPVYPADLRVGMRKRQALRNVGPFCEAEFGSGDAVDFSFDLKA